MPARGKSSTQSAAAPPWILKPGHRIRLPSPAGAVPGGLEACLAARRTVRDYSGAPITLEQLSKLVWAAQGVTGVGGLRTAPSAGATYPLKLYVVVSNVEGLAAGVYTYEPDAGELAFIAQGQRRKRLCLAAMGQECVFHSPVALLLVSWEKRIRAEFGDAARKLIAMECGHVAQNVLLEAVALGLGAAGLAKFDADALREVVAFRSDENPEYLLLAGHATARGK